MGEILSSFWDWIKSGIIAVIDLIPDSPFRITIPSFFESYLGYINYFIPIGMIVNTLVLWCAAIVAYYIIMVILRFLKVIE